MSQFPITRLRRGLGTLAVVFVLGLLIWSSIPRFVGGGPSKIGRIANNLRQLDGAVQQWALDHRRPDTAMVTRQDVAPYLQRLRHNGWVESVAGEFYTLGSVTNSPQAELTREFGGRPKGTIFRLGTNGALEIILPKRSGVDAGRASLFAFLRPCPGATHRERSS